ncbi:hypothetical protein ACOBR2_19575 [Telmatobacter bradus]|uniref:hypothetical protein n=1 Tax=Telmatobacter bradus TaxID=474953 RepID=UPI003B42965D
MPPLSEIALKNKVLEYAAIIQAEQQAEQCRIRALQNKMLEGIPVEQWPMASTALDAILGKAGVIHMSGNHYHFENVGVANTGEITGNVAGNSQRTDASESAQALLQAFSQFKLAVQNDKALTVEQREDAIAATSELETEVKKPQGTWSMSKIRNGIAALKTLGAGAQTLYGVYQELHPLIAAHFNLPM